MSLFSRLKSRRRFKKSSYIDNAISIDSPSMITAMPWFGMDIGGTLTKLVYFEPNDDEPEGDQEAKVLRNIRRYLTKNSAYGQSGHRDIHLQVSTTTGL